VANETTVQSAWWVRAIALLPLPLLHGIARGLAFLALNVLPYRPKVVRGNLSTAFPEWDARTLRRTMRDFYRGYADVMLELLKAARLEPEELRRRMRLVNPELLHAEIDAGRPVVLFAAHQCNWEWILLALSIEGLPVDCAYKPLVNEWANREMHALRTRFGARMVAVDDMMRDVIARRRVPRVIALVSDQEPVASDRRHWTTFLNRDSAFFMGGEVIADKLGYPAYFVAIRRVGRGRYEATFELLAPTGATRVEGELTEVFARRVERQIREAPADWPWSHKRWRLARD
jgi:KDO2-lipid IV(A) lauroyltransferase